MMLRFEKKYKGKTIYRHIRSKLTSEMILRECMKQFKLLQKDKQNV